MNLSQSKGSQRLLLIGILGGLALMVAFLGTQLGVQSDSPLTCLVEDTRTGGGSAIYAWAQRLGFQVRPLDVPLWEVSQQLTTSGNCVITAGNDQWNPFQKDSEDVPWPSIERWISQGNTLIVIASQWRQVPTELSRIVRDAAHLKDNPINGDFTKKYFKNVKTETIPTWWGGTLEVRQDTVRSKYGIPPNLVRAGTTQDVRLAQVTVGSGAIVIFLDDYAWTNAGFDRADNAATLARILREQIKPGGILGFDQYRHGRGRAESFVTFFFSLPGAGVFLWLTLGVVALWFWGNWQRLGPAEEFRETERRTAFEYVQSVAAIYERARATPLALQAVLNRVTHILSRRGLIGPREQQVLNRAQQRIHQQHRSAHPTVERTLITELIQLRGNQLKD